MKTKFFGAVVVVAIAVGAMINVNLNKVSNKGDLALANVEALAAENFHYAGTDWNVTDTHNWGTYWCPLLKDCTVSEGFDYVYHRIVTYPGHFVGCYEGNGNCWDGTMCS